MDLVKNVRIIVGQRITDLFPTVFFCALGVALEGLLQILSGVGILDLCHLFGSSLGNYHSSAVAALGTEVNDVVGSLDYVKIMLDDDDGISALDKSLKHLDKLCHVCGMKSGSRLVKNVDSLTGASARKFGRKFDSLSLTTRKLS